MIFQFLVIISLLIDIHFSQTVSELLILPPLTLLVKSFNFKRNFDTSQFILPSLPKSYDKCKICTFHPNNGRSTPNSSGRDAILTIGCNKLTNLLLFVKTVRTTGCKCRFIVFADDTAMKRYSSDFYEACSNCGVEFINFHGLKIRVDIACLRFRIYADFLIINRVLFDRIYICDLFDTIVQHDPFTTDFGQMVYFSDEGFKIAEDSINQYWIGKCFSDMEEKSNDKDFIFSENLKKISLILILLILV